MIFQVFDELEAVNHHTLATAAGRKHAAMCVFL